MQFGGQAYEIAKDEDIEALWQKHISTNPHVTKAVIETFGGVGKSLTDSQLSELGKRSKAANLPYFAHVSTLNDGKRAIKAGATALAHGINSEAIDDEFITLMKKHNVTYIPTLAVYHNHSDEKHNHTVLTKRVAKPFPKKLQGCLFENQRRLQNGKKCAWEERKTACKYTKAT
ncbi:hypothetical protein ACOBV8_20980 (plasmid) [Pseudoalteromonas espejiana]